MTNRVALITGGASGIGKEVAKLLVTDGITTIITGRRAELGAAAAEELNTLAQQGAHAEFIQNDVSDEAAVQELFRTIDKKYGRLDYAVNNAAISNETAPLGDSETANFREMVDINIFGVYFGMKEEIKLMSKNSAGSIVNLASIAGLNGIPYASAYAATKHAVVGLTKSAALDYAAQNIRVNGVAPGATKTDIIATQLEGGDENYNEASISAMHPVGRLGRPEEIAQAIYWLLSDKSSFTTGHILSADGGFQAK